MSAGRRIRLANVWEPLVLIVFGGVPASLMAMMASLMVALGVDNLTTNKKWLDFFSLSADTLPILGLILWGASAIAATVCLWVVIVNLALGRPSGRWLRIGLLVGIADAISMLLITGGGGLLVAIPAIVAAIYLVLRRDPIPRSNGDSDLDPILW